MCNHQWQKEYEELLVGGVTPVGWRCKKCKKFVSSSDMSPSGLAGEDTKEKVLVGPLGGTGRCSDGSRYVRQIYYPDGRLEIIRPKKP